MSNASELRVRASVAGPEAGPGPWPYRLALWTVLCAIPLVLFGGSVTTLGAGMAVEGWLVAEGHFLLFFPTESWFRDTATFVEHTHRLFGVLVGLAAVATVAVTWRLDRRPLARGFALAGLLAVCAQGTLGGFRVLENSPRLAFLHGAVAQAVFALLCATAVVLAPQYGRAPESNEAGRTAGGPYPRGLALAALVAVYAQVALGAWYRHALRPAASQEAAARLLVHLGGALVVTALVWGLARRLARAPRPAALERAPRRLGVLLGLQLLVGVLAWLGHRPEAVGPLEWGLSILHVLGGGLLLAECTRCLLWCARPAGARWLVARASVHAVPEPFVEGAR